MGAEWLHAKGWPNRHEKANDPFRSKAHEPKKSDPTVYNTNRLFLITEIRVFTPHYKLVFKQNRLSFILKKLGLSILKSTSNISNENKTTLRQTYIENVRANKSSYLIDNTETV